MVVSEYRVNGMTCGHCEMSVREEVGQLPGVAAVDVSAESGILRVTGDGSFDDGEVVAAVNAAGYTAVRVG
ncbi:heavy-metal-associated domain-containing protein [Mycobacterium sp.]|uniref:heavy-metal-associated domain-containing protein n=1 Tax=Mycobacterium sp. TaxID=1785 RepID=UPI0025FA16FF|nr:heavy-metal-associated domain-containing protein [Mycobacterium sp.]